MNPTQRLNLITDIALNLQENSNTEGINILLSGYGIKTDDVTFVSSKRSYVIKLLKLEPIDTIIQIAKDLEIPLPENIGLVFKSESVMLKKLNRIFISHSSLDKKIVEKLIDILEAMGVPSSTIFCSSFEGYGIKLGSDFLDKIKEELDGNVLVLFLLSDNFYSSVVSLCEMGATWVKTNHHIPILIPPFEYNDIKGVIPTTHGMKINEKEKLNSLKERIEELFDLNSNTQSIWERKRDKILKEIKEILDSKGQQNEMVSVESNSESKRIPVIADSEITKQKIKEKSKVVWPDDFEMQLDYIQRQNMAIAKLENHNPIDIDIDDFNLIRKKAQQNWVDDFEMQLDQEQRQVESLRRLKKI